MIVAGSRTIRHYEVVEAAIFASGFAISEVVSGGQVSIDPETKERYGADYFGEQWANLHGVPVKRFKADWSKHGRAAGPIRNKAMAEYAGALIAVREGRESSRGTTDMIALARARGLVIFVWEVEEHSHWAADRSAYILPTGQRVPVWNGHVLWMHRRRG